MRQGMEIETKLENHVPCGQAATSAGIPRHPVVSSASFQLPVAFGAFKKEKKEIKKEKKKRKNERTK